MSSMIYKPNVKNNFFIIPEAETEADNLKDKSDAKESTNDVTPSLYSEVAVGQTCKDIEPFGDWAKYTLDECVAQM